jgi:integrase
MGTKKQRRIRHHNDGLRKLCEHPRRVWAKCPDSWYLNFKPKGGPSYRLSLDREMGRHLESRTEAETEADRIRGAIRAGTFRQPTSAATTPDALTFEDFGAKWIKGAASVSGKKTWQNDAYVLARIGAWSPEGAPRFGLKPIGAITEDDVEALRVYLRMLGRASNTWNHYLQVLKSLSKWGLKKGYLTRPWFGPDSDLKREKPRRRHRRLAPGEEDALLKHAKAHLQRLAIAAVETGCRLGELLRVQWADVDLARGELRIRAENAKDAEERILPLSARLKAVLEMGQTDPAGQPFGADRYVFGDTVGRRVRAIKTAWRATCRRAGIMDLHFHDLRHEAGSRLLEAGWPLHHVKDMLGHANISTTDTYLNVTKIGLQESMRRFDRPAEPEAAEVSTGVDNSPRCNLVANERRNEQRFLCNDADDTNRKRLTH